MNIPVTKMTIVRLVLIAVVSFSLIFLLPNLAKEGSQRYDLVPAGLTAVILGFLIFHAADRRRQLLQTVNMELNKLRRIYHLSKNLSDVDGQRYRGWFTELHGNLYAYMSGFSDRDFSRYEESNKDFRALSYHVYKVPELRSNKEESLYDELLRTIAVAAESRQHIKEAKESRLSPYVWLIVLLLVLNVVVTAWLSTDVTDVSFVVTGLTVTSFLFAVDLLWEVDTLASERRDIAKRYVDNIGRIELRRRNDE
ncbi:MAG: hypothetical protein V1738_06745 [Patescibacteria group bacterium]